MLYEKLKRYTLDIDYDENVISVENDDGQYMNAYEVDEAIAELKQKLEDAKAILKKFRLTRLKKQRTTSLKRAKNGTPRKQLSCSRRRRSDVLF